MDIGTDYDSLHQERFQSTRRSLQFHPQMSLVSLYESSVKLLCISVLRWINNVLYRLIISRLDLLVTAVLLSNQLPIGEQKIILNFNKLQAAATRSIIHTAPGSNKTGCNYADKIQHKQKKWKLALNKTKKGERREENKLVSCCLPFSVSRSLFLSLGNFT